MGVWVCLDLVREQSFCFRFFFSSWRYSGQFNAAVFHRHVLNGILLTPMSELQ